MTQATTDIFELIVARQAVGRPWDVRVSWRASQQGDRVVQVYVDQALAAVTTCSETRALDVLLDPSLRRTVELLAVPKGQAGRDMPHLLASWRRGERHAVRADVLRDEAFDASASLVWRIDQQTERRDAIWPRDTHRGGFGGLFGLGAFGFDHATGPGLGRGQLGWGPLGTGGEALRIREHAQPAGEHTLSLRLLD
ncbi:MAG: hypothetical protein ACOC1G_07480, partial [Phycisphaeraceae bacterium]